MSTPPQEVDVFSSKLRGSVLVLAGALLVSRAGAAAMPSAPCAGGATRLCLLGRFAIEATSQDEQGRQRAATAAPVGDGAGVFSFFAAEGADLLVQLEPAHAGGPPAIRFATLADAAFTLRVLDVDSGAAWSYEGRRGRFVAGRTTLDSTAADTPRAEMAAARSSSIPETTPSGAVADLLERRATERPTGMGAQDVSCRASRTALCLLGDRFRVRVLFEDGGRQGLALPTGGEPDSGLFALTSVPRALVAARLVDGRRINGSFWVLAATLGAAAATVEVTDVVAGRTRRLQLRGDAPASLVDLDAFAAKAATVQVSLDGGRAVTGEIGPAGGALPLTDAQGNRFLLTIPPRALDVQTEVTLTPVASIAGLPFPAGPTAAVRITPEGLLPAESALLTITPAVAVPTSQQLTFAFRGLAGELFLTPPRNQAALVVPVHRFGGYGLAAGSAADLAAQLLRAPSREQDRLAQRLAGLLLPLRRSAAFGKLPPSVLALLRSEYATAIQPMLGAIATGAKQGYLPLTRAFVDSVKDTGLSAQLKSGADATKRKPLLIDVVHADEVKAARLALARSLAACTGLAGGDAAVSAFASYNQLKYLRAATPTDTTRVLNCVHFELRFDTEVASTASNTREHDVVPSIVIALSLNLADGFFYGQSAAPQTPSLTITDCTTTKVAEVDGVFKANRVLVNSMGQFDDELAALVRQVAVTYEVVPLPVVKWTQTCGDPIQTSWWVIYGFFHTDELAGTNAGFRSVLGRSTNSQVWAERGYLHADAGAPFSEDTFFLFVHRPLG